ncbi:MAG: NAD(P)-dependent oxidoreductase, partial [Candidatus Omnitrophota bacterium]
MKNNKSANNIKRILILGHSGFIGSHLMRNFCDKEPQIELIGKSIPEIDLTKLEDVKSLSPFFDMETVVIMCAAIKRQFGDNLDTFSQNLAMVTNLCRILEQRLAKRFIFFSSAAVYGEDISNTNITEDTPVCPTSFYGMAKYICERLLIKNFNQSSKGSLFILRPPLIYGPGDMGSTYGPAGFIKAALNNEKITLWGDGLE